MLDASTQTDIAIATSSSWAWIDLSCHVNVKQDFNLIHNGQNFCIPDLAEILHKHLGESPKTQMEENQFKVDLQSVLTPSSVDLSRSPANQEMIEICFMHEDNKHAIETHRISNKTSVVENKAPYTEYSSVVRQNNKRDFLIEVDFDSSSDLDDVTEDHSYFIKKEPSDVSNTNTFGIENDYVPATEIEESGMDNYDTDKNSMYRCETRDKSDKIMDHHIASLDDDLLTSQDKSSRIKNTNTCLVCGKNFDRKSTLTTHLRTHTGEKPYKCPHCDKAYKENGALKKHLTTHTKVRPYECMLCDKNFALPGLLKSHLKIHSDEKPHTCIVCGKTFRHKSNLGKHLKVHSKKHLTTHTEDKPYACMICDKHFARPSLLKRHMKIHSEDKPHTCMNCGKTFRDKSKLSRHLKIHSKQPEKIHEYPIISDENELRAKHEKQELVCNGAQDDKYMHQNERNEFLIKVDLDSSSDLDDVTTIEPIDVSNTNTLATENVCEPTVENGKSSVNDADTKTDKNSERSDKRTDSHIASIDNDILTPQEEYSCNKNSNTCHVCGKNCDRKSTLITHLRTHTGEKPYKCPLCDKAYKENGALKKHLTTHTKVRPYPCMLCDKNFPFAHSLKSHMKIHSEEKPHVCITCGKTFRYKGNLNLHMKIHSKHSDSVEPHTKKKKVPTATLR